MIFLGTKHITEADQWIILVGEICSKDTFAIELLQEICCIYGRIGRYENLVVICERNLDVYGLLNGDMPLCPQFGLAILLFF